MNNTTSQSNVTSEPEGTHKPSVADALFDRDVRLIVLYLEVILGTIGGVCVCLWLWANWWRKSRVNKLILNVAISDLLVVYLATLPQLVWEYDRHWKAGEFCKILRYTTSFAMMASNYMLVVLSVDRHQAIMHPLKDPVAVWKMAGVGWGTAALLSLPQLAVFHTNFVTVEGPFQNMTVCESIFRDRPKFHRQAYLTFISLVVFYIPLLLIMFCYIRIFIQIRNRASEGRNPSARGSCSKSQQARPDKVQLQSSQCSSFNKAKIKILKMTVVVVAAFAICNLPYHILEMIYSYGDHTSVNPIMAAIIGGMAVANSSVNPFVFLAFNATRTCINGLFPWIKIPREPSVYDSNISTRSEYVSHHGNAATALTDISRAENRSHIYSPRNTDVAKKRGDYCRVDSEDLTERPSVILNDNTRAQVSFCLKDNKYNY